MKSLIFALSFVFAFSIFAAEQSMEKPTNVQDFVKFLESEGFNAKGQTFSLIYPSTATKLNLVPQEAFEIVRDYERAGSRVFDVRVVDASLIFTKRPVDGYQLNKIEFRPTYTATVAGSATKVDTSISCAANITFTGKNNNMINLENFAQDWPGYSYELKFSNPEEVKLTKIYGSSVMVERLKNGESTAQLVIHSQDKGNFVVSSQTIKVPECDLFPVVAKRMQAKAQNTLVASNSYNWETSKTIYSDTYKYVSLPAQDTVSTQVAAVKKVEVKETTKVETKPEVKPEPKAEVKPEIKKEVMTPKDPTSCIHLKDNFSNQDDQNVSHETVVYENTCEKPISCKLSYFASYSSEMGGNVLAKSKPQWTPAQNIEPKKTTELKFENKGEEQYNGTYAFITYENTATHPDCTWTTTTADNTKKESTSVASK